MNKTLFILIISLTIILPNVIGQQIGNQITLGYHRGFVFSHNNEVAHLGQLRPKGIEVRWLNNRGDHRAYKKNYHSPDRGIAFFAYDSQSEILGKTMGLYAFFDLVLWRNRKKTIEWYAELGAGLGYNTRPYDQYKNNQNIMIGSAFGSVMNAKGGFKFQLTPKLTSNHYIGLFHISNGAIKLPNAGMNIPHIGSSIQYNFGQSFDPSQKEYSPSHNEVIAERTRKGWSREVVFKIGWKQGLHPRSQINAVYGLTFAMNRSTGQLSTLQFGIDVMRNHNIRSIQKENFLDLQKNKIFDFHQAGGYFAHLLKVGRTDLVTGFGYYFYRPYKNTRSITYQRWGVRYHFSKRLLASWILMANGGAADYIEYQIGYKF